MRITGVLATAAAAALITSVLVGCGVVVGVPADPADAGQEPAGGAAGLLGDGTWELTAGTVDGTGITVPAGHRVTLVFTTDDAGDRVGGTAACNGYGASVTVSGSAPEYALTVSGDLVQTEMACEPEVMAAEQAYLQALPRVTAATRDADTLTLTGDGVSLAFSQRPPVPTAALTGTTWRLDALVTIGTAEGTDDGAVSSVVGEPALLRLDDAGDGRGTLTGSTGCRDLTGEYVVQGDEILATTLDAGTRECPADLAGQDSHVVAVLGDGFRAAVDGTTLTLTSAGGLGLVYQAERAATP